MKHPSIIHHCFPLVRSRVCVCGGATPADSGREAGTNGHGRPDTWRHATITPTIPESPITQTCMKFLYGGGNTGRARQLHTERPGPTGGFQPTTFLLCCGICLDGVQPPPPLVPSPTSLNLDPEGFKPSHEPQRAHTAPF